MDKQKTKLIRNLKPGDIIQVTDAVRYPVITSRVRTTHVHESSPGFMTGRRRWTAHFEWIHTPEVYTAYHSFMSITGYSDERIEVYNA